jgi:hypothetical protein
VLFVLNSSVADWYFRLGSTNAAVSHYQLTNLPCPRFGERQGSVDEALRGRIEQLIEARGFAAIEAECIALAAANGSGPTMERVIISLVTFIEAEEHRRGVIARSQRSRLAEDAEKCQVVLDKLMLVLLGLGGERHAYIRARLAEML